MDLRVPTFQEGEGRTGGQGLGRGEREWGERGGGEGRGNEGMGRDGINIPHGRLKTLAALYTRRT